MTKQYNRRHFLGSAVALGAGAAAWPFSRALAGAVAACCGSKGRAAEQVSPSVRLGTIGLIGPHLKFQDPGQWASLH